MGLSAFVIVSCFLFGLAVGSFLNVVIYRVPRELSIVYPPSSCPNCNRPIKPWENIPLISYLVILRGKCAGCRQPISIQYPLVEIVTGIMFALVGWQYGWSFETIIYLGFTAALIALSVIDLQTRLLPDTIVFPGLIVAVVLALAAVHPLMHDMWKITPVKAFWGMTAGGMPLLILAWAYVKLTGREGMGGGDIKLMFFVGALLGPGKAFLTLFIGSLSGAVIGSLFLRFAKKKRHTQIPFGPFLSAGAWLAMIWGSTIIRRYLVYSDLIP